MRPVGLSEETRSPLHVRRKGVSPEVGLELVVEVDPTHAHLGSIRGPG